MNDLAMECTLGFWLLALEIFGCHRRNRGPVSPPVSLISAERHFVLSASMIPCVVVSSAVK